VLPLRYTLLADGSSDRCLLPIIDWVLADTPASQGSFVSQVADLRGLSTGGMDLRSRAQQAVARWPCDVLFVHRDAEGAPLADRLAEIRAATEELEAQRVPLIPVRMTEAWLLIDEAAIRSAADNPHGTAAIPLPELKRIEREVDPKALLYRCLQAASGKTGRKLARFRRSLPKRAHLVVGAISNFSPLRELSAFARFEAATREVVASLLG